MKVQLASDLHLEFPDNREWLEKNPLIPSADILILAGDIVCDKFAHLAFPFYHKISKQFKQIISCKGNHEFYHGDISYAFISRRGSILHNHVWINNKSIRIEDVRFVVTTLWTHIPPEYDEQILLGLNDYSLITRTHEDGKKIPLDTSDVNEFHEWCRKCICSKLNKPFDGKTVIVTHHLPSFKCITNRPPYPELNHAYATDLEYLMEDPQITHWFHGHSHDFHECKIHNTHVVRNPLGYVIMGEHKDFRRDFVVEI